MSHNLPSRLLIFAIFIPVVVGASLAFFRDQETSAGNQFTAGGLDLQLSSVCFINGQPCPSSPAANSPNHLLFNLSNLLPGDTGTASANLQIIGNYAWLCSQLQINSAPDLVSALMFTIWQDTNCNQQLEPPETIYQSEQALTSASWPIFDSTSVSGPLSANQPTCLSLFWNFPASAGNQLQTQNLTFDLNFSAHQAANQPNFLCPSSVTPIPPPSPSPTDTPPAPSSTPTPTPAPPEGLIFSEYIEGTSSNKAVEIYNPTSGSINLSDYQVLVYTNGSVSPTAINLTGTLSSGSVFVLCHPSFVDPPRTQVCQQVSGSLNVNGNDAISLRQISSNTLLDVIGVIGENPGTEWGTGLVSTADNTLVRICSVINGNPLGFNPLSNLTSEWTGYPVNTFSSLGFHPCL